MIKIVLDSSADLAPGLHEKFEWINLPVFFGEEKYIDGVNLTHKEFYEKLTSSSDLPKTSQAAPFEFSELFQRITSAGDEAVVLTISKKLSGTYQSAAIAAVDFPGKVHVVDAETVTIGTGVLAEYALELAEKAESGAQLAEMLEAEKKRVRLVALVDTLEYLRKGGRISKTVAFAGELLSFKPVVAVADGEVKLLGKARGAKAGDNLLEQEIKKAGGVDFSKPVLLGYSGTDNSKLRSYVEDFSTLWQGHSEALRASEIGCVVGTHAGPGAIAVAFFAAE